MLQPRQGVFSRQFGYGQVIIGGGRPFVRWLDGREGYLAADELESMSAVEYDALVIQRNQAEREIELFAYGDEILGRWHDPWIIDSDGFWILASRRQEVVDRKRTIPRPDMEDVNVFMDVLSPAEVPDSACVIECAVTRLNGQSRSAPG